MHFNQCQSIKSKKFPKCRCPYSCINNTKFCGRHLRMVNPVLFVSEKSIKSDDYDYDYIIKSSRIPYEMIDDNMIKRTYEYYGIKFIPDAPLYDSYSNIITYLKLQENLTDAIKSSIIKFQAIFKGFLLRKRLKCCNKESLLTLESILMIDNKYYVQIKTDEQHYGFNIKFLYTHIIVNKKIFNPYNPSISFSDKNLQYIEYKINKCKERNISLINVCEDPTLTKEQIFNFKVVDIFNKIDELGNYTKSSWFLSLNINQLKNFYIQFEDLWNYRLQIPITQKKKIVHNGKLFMISTNTIKNYPNTNISKRKIQLILLSIIDRIISEGHTIEEKKMGALYTLTALVIVSNDAAEAYPFLVQPI